MLLDDCYNANPQSVTAALEVLGRTDCERRVAVLGDMGELGDLTEQAHFNAGALAAMLGIDFVIAIGSKAARIADGAAMSGGDVVHFATKEEALPHGAGAAAAQHQYADQGVPLPCALSGMTEGLAEVL